MVMFYNSDMTEIPKHKLPQHEGSLYIKMKSSISKSREHSVAIKRVSKIISGICVRYFYQQEHYSSKITI